MRRTGLPGTYRRWLFRFSAVCCTFAAGGLLLAGDLVTAVWVALIGLQAGLAAYDFDTSPRPGHRLLFRSVAVVVIGLALYRILFTLASPT